jgi:hypothetical protein
MTPHHMPYNPFALYIHEYTWDVGSHTHLMSIHFLDMWMNITWITRSYRICSRARPCTSLCPIHRVANWISSPASRGGAKSHVLSTMSRWLIHDISNDHLYYYPAKGSVWWISKYAICQPGNNDNLRSKDHDTIVTTRTACDYLIAPTLLSRLGGSFQ